MPATKIYRDVSGWGPVTATATDATLHSFSFDLAAASAFPDATALPANLVALVQFDCVYENADAVTSSAGFKVFQGYHRLTSGSLLPFGTTVTAGPTGSLVTVVANATGTSARLQVTTHATLGSGFLTVTAAVRFMMVH